MKILKRILWWVIPNIGGAYLLYLSFIEHIAWEWNVASFYYWTTSITSIPLCLLLMIASAMSEDSKKRIAEMAERLRKPKIITTFDVCFDLTICFVLAAFSHWVLAAFYFVHILANYWMFQVIEEAAKDYNKEGMKK